MTDLSILLADFKILIHARSDHVIKQCVKYTTPEPLTPDEADLEIEVSEEEIRADMLAAEIKVTPGYSESICIYRAICRRIPIMGGMLLHAAMISDGAYGYAFTANSGTGKTTHIRQWLQAFGEEIRVINGDKPIIRKRDGVWYAYGTPWCGKEGLNVNTSVPLAGICFLRRGETNTIQPFSAASAVPEIMPQLLIPDEPETLIATLELLDQLVTDIPLYELYCTISEEAARVARAGMTPRL